MSGKGSRALVGRDLNAKARAIQALELRIQGYSQAKIAEMVGLSQPAVSRAIKRALKERTESDVDELRALESERIDALHAQMWQQVNKGNVNAGMVITRLMDRRARLQGLDPATASDATARHAVAVYVGLDENVPPEREDEAIDAAIGAALQAVGPLGGMQQPRIFVRVYQPGVLEGV